MELPRSRSPPAPRARRGRRSLLQEVVRLPLWAARILREARGTSAEEMRRLVHIEEVMRRQLKDWITVAERLPDRLAQPPIDQNYV